MQKFVPCCNQKCIYTKIWPITHWELKRYLNRVDIKRFRPYSSVLINWGKPDALVEDRSKNVQLMYEQQISWQLKANFLSFTGDKCLPSIRTFDVSWATSSPCNRTSQNQTSSTAAFNVLSTRSSVASIQYLFITSTIKPLINTTAAWMTNYELSNNNNIVQPFDLLFSGGNVLCRTPERNFVNNFVYQTYQVSVCTS